MAEHIEAQADLVKKVAEFANVSADVVRAANYGENQLTDLFNRATEAAKWDRISNYGFMMAGGGFLTNAFASGPGSSLSWLGLAAVVSGAATMLLSIKKRDSLKIGGEVRQRADERLVELDAKDRGQTPAPKL